MVNLNDITGPVILDSAGRYIDLLNPQPEDMDVQVIARALSKLCRYTGHVRRFYSVAEHAWHCSFLVPPGLELTALHHDDSEAFTGDASSPLKVALGRVFADIEMGFDRVVAQAFGTQFPHGPEVKTADLAMLRQERDEMLPPIGAWRCLKGIKPPIGRTIFNWEPEVAEVMFLKRHEALTQR